MTPVISAASRDHRHRSNGTEAPGRKALTTKPCALLYHRRDRASARSAGDSQRLPVATEHVVRGDPLLGDHGRTERELAAEHGRGNDLGELLHLALAVAA